MKLRSGSFSGKLLRRAKSKAKLEDTSTQVPELPIPPVRLISGREGVSSADCVQILPTVKLDAYLHLPFGNSSASSSSSPPSRALPPPPKKGLHRRSRSFSELLSIASSTLSHDQPWRSREAWAAIHSPSQEPLRRKPEGRVIDRTYGWIERGDPHSSLYANTLGERDVTGRQDFRFFNNTQQKVPPSAIDSDDEDYDIDDTNRVRLSHRDMRQPARSRLNESVTIGLSRGSTSSSSISTMDLSLNPHTPPTSFDNEFPLIHSHLGRHGGSHSATPSDESDLLLPPLIPDLVKRAVSPPAFTGFPSPAPWAQRSPRKDIREASNLRWAKGDQSSTDSSPDLPARKALKDRLAETVAAAQRGSGMPTHQRKRSTTLPSTFTQSALAAEEATEVEARPESGTLPELAVVSVSPSVAENPPRPARHPRRLPPVPVLVHVPAPHQSGGLLESTDTSSSQYGPEAVSPGPKGPSAYYRPSILLRSTASQQSLQPPSRRPSTAPTPPSSSPLAFGARSRIHSEQRQSGLYHSPNPSPLPSATFQNQRRSRQHSGTSSAGRGGWI